MDPNATLKEIREILNADSMNQDLQRLAELVEALDNWLSNGGFWPQAWK